VKAYFLDTSAFLKRYLKETGSDIIDSVFEEDSLRYVSTLCLLECFSNIQWLHTVDRLITSDQLQALHAAVASDIDSGRVTVVNATPADIEAAVEILTKQYLTAVDALQIATAKTFGPRVVLISSNAKLNRVAMEQGLTVLGPSRQA
jgi:predicted nucleic acid-binding protein